MVDGREGPSAGSRARRHNSGTDRRYGQDVRSCSHAVADAEKPQRHALTAPPLRLTQLWPQGQFCSMKLHSARHTEPWPPFAQKVFSPQSSSVSHASPSPRAPMLRHKPKFAPNAIGSHVSPIGHSLPRAVHSVSKQYPRLKSSFSGVLGLSGCPNCTQSNPCWQSLPPTAHSARHCPLSSFRLFGSSGSSKSSKQLDPGAQLKAAPPSTRGFAWPSQTSPAWAVPALRQIPPSCDDAGRGRHVPVSPLLKLQGPFNDAPSQNS